MAMESDLTRIFDIKLKKKGTQQIELIIKNYKYYHRTSASLLIVMVSIN